MTGEVHEHLTLDEIRSYCNVQLVQSDSYILYSMVLLETLKAIHYSEMKPSLSDVSTTHARPGVSVLIESY